MWIISYWIFPCISAVMWLAMLLTMLLVWTVADGSPVYPSMEAGQTIAYISDVGAQHLKPLFIAGGAITTVFLDLSFVSERWLRHRGRLARNLSVFEKVSSGLSIVFALLGTCGMILLTVFDTLRHPKLHDGFLVLFLGGYIVSAIFICAEYQRLGIKYRQHKILRFSFWMKLAFIVVEFALAIAFGVCGDTNRHNDAAVLEWSIALIFTFYVLSFLVDLLPSVRTRHHVPQGEMEMWVEGRQQNGQPGAPTSTRTNGEFEVEQPLTQDSAGPNPERGGGRKTRQLLGRNF